MVNAGKEIAISKGFLY